MPVRRVWLLLDLKTREHRLFDSQSGAEEHRDVIISASKRARTDIESGGIPPREVSEFYIDQVNI